jgi:Inheritance of peroxisomes protein 1
MHPILPKSQCWCVDDSSSKFVLQIRRPQYWRIEVPVADPDDQRTSEGLKNVLSQILLFEKTPCPFRRSFTVELPEAPTTPLKRRPWRPVHTPKSRMDETDSPGAPPETESGEEYYSAVSDENVNHEGMDSDSDATDDTNATPRNTFHRSVLPPLDDQDIVSNSRALRTGRSVTAPPQLTIITSSPSNDGRTMSPLSRSRSIESVSSDYSSSVESFHTVQSWHSPITPLPPSPPQSRSTSPTTYPYPHDNISLPKRPIHTREISEITITPESPRVWEITRGSSTESVRQVNEQHSTPPPKMPTKVNDFEENLDQDHFGIAPPPSQQQIRHRPTTGSNSRRRTLSPLPPAANIFSPSRRRPRRLQTARHLPTAIIQKTYEILLSPPSHLLHLMLNIAAKIAAGEWRGMVFGFGEGGEKIVGEWDYEDGDLMGDSWDEDDYGISLGGKQPSNSNAAREQVGRSWEVD